jgi:hypothetical protein
MNFWGRFFNSVLLSESSKGCMVWTKRIKRSVQEFKRTQPNTGNKVGP